MAEAQCSICSRDDVGLIDDKLAEGVPPRQVAQEHPGPHHTTFQRHLTNHLKPALAAIQAEANKGIGNLARMENLYEKAEHWMREAEKEGHTKNGIAAIDSARKVLELILRVTGELDERPTVQVLNLHTSAEYLQLQQVLARSLAPWPEARIAVASALRELE